jgi:hypothetical protein
MPPDEHSLFEFILPWLLGQKHSLIKKQDA